MPLIQDRIVVTRPTRVLIGVERGSRALHDYSLVNEIVAEWWVDEGADLTLEPWIEHGVRNEGWKVTRHPGSQVVLDIEGGEGAINWRGIAGDLAGALRAEDPDAERDRAALDKFEMGQMFEAPPEEEQP
jgi:hypothetical protein